MAETTDPVEQYVEEVKRLLDDPEHSRGVAEYQWTGKTFAGLGYVQRCECGALVLLSDREAHDRFHSVLNDHAKALAVLEVSHIAAHVHDRYDVRTRIRAGENEPCTE